MDELEQETAPVVAGGGEASQPPQAQEVEGTDETLPISASMAVAAAADEDEDEDEDDEEKAVETMEVAAAAMNEEEEGEGSSAAAGPEESGAEEEEEEEEEGMEVGGGDGGAASASEAEEGEGESSAAEMASESEGSDAAAKLPAKLVPAKSAWMLYSMDMREVVKREQPLLKMTEQIKAISEKWKALADEERQPYLDRAAADKQRYLAEKEALAASKAKAAAKGNKGKKGAGAFPGPREVDNELHFPLARIKRIMKLDPEVKSASKDATLLISKATELFLDLLGEEASKASGRRRTLKAADAAAGMRRKPSLAFLRPDFPLDAAADAAAKKKPEAPKVAKLAEADRKRLAKAKAAAAAAAAAAQGNDASASSASEAEGTAGRGRKGGKGKAVAVVEGGAITSFFAASKKATPATDASDGEQ